MPGVRDDEMKKTQGELAFAVFGFIAWYFTWELAFHHFYEADASFAACPSWLSGLSD